MDIAYPLKRIWQRSMIWLARRDDVRKWAQNRKQLSTLANRFVAGNNLTATQKTIEDYASAGITSSIYYLGEYVDTPELVEENVSELLATIQHFGATSLDWFACVDPTQIGYSISNDMGWENAQRLGTALRELPDAEAHPLMVDMEDASVVQETIDLYDQLCAEGVPTAITLQAYLFRTVQDYERIASQGGTIRLVKGAFVASSRIAHASKKDIDDAFLRLALLALSPAMKKAGHRPIFATHDDRILKLILPVAEANGWQPEDFEIEMLLGVREPYQRELAAKDYTVRVYMPYGEAWWPYGIRRVGENPANAGFVLRAMMNP